MLSTTATKRSIRPSPDSQRDSPGCEDSPRASSRTAASLSASGGSVVPGAPSGSLPPGVGGGSGLAVAPGAPGACAGGTTSCAGEGGGGCRGRNRGEGPKPGGAGTGAAAAQSVVGLRLI